MAATILAGARVPVVLYDAMPKVGRKFLVAGRSGLNLTRSEELHDFAGRYGEHAHRFEQMLAAFSPDGLRAWLRQLGVETFVGTSGRVFPEKEKAAAILRRWTERLSAQGVVFRTGWRWIGFGPTGRLLFQVGDRQTEVAASAVVLALGGASWPQTGSDGGWTAVLEAAGCLVVPFAPANCGFEVAWSAFFRERHSGDHLKNLLCTAPSGETSTGDLVFTDYGVEGGAIYPLSRPLRMALERDGVCVLRIDLKRDLELAEVERRLFVPRKGITLASLLRKSLKLSGPVLALLKECCSSADLGEPRRLATCVKSLPLVISACRPLAEAISSAGGLSFAELSDDLMIRRLPGIFVAGEMLDWEAPTGGYLLQGAFSSGHWAARGVLAWLADAGGG